MDGDANYDGSVDGTDLGIVLADYNRTFAGDAGPRAISTATAASTAPTWAWCWRTIAQFRRGRRSSRAGDDCPANRGVGGVGLAADIWSSGGLSIEDVGCRIDRGRGAIRRGLSSILHPYIRNPTSHVHCRLVRQPADEGRPPRAGRADAGLADAPGRPLSARISPAAADDARFSICARRPTSAPRSCSRTVERLGVDAAILFSDLLLILEPMGIDLEFSAGEGPVLHNPIRTAADVDRLLELETVEPLGFVMETVRKTRAGLPESLPLIGFAGAPFTLAAYAIEGGSSRDYRRTKTLMYTDTGAWDALMGRLARAVTLYLNAQIDAGAQLVQLFDSWAGCLGPDDYRRYVLPHSRSVIESLRPGVPVIHFATGNPALLPLLGEAFGKKKRPAVVGVDWRIRLDDAWRVIGHEQGDAGQSRSGGAVGRAAGNPPSREGAFSIRPPAAPATFSTSATASCRKRRSRTSWPWSRRCMSSAGGSQ